MKRPWQAVSVSRAGVFLHALTAPVFSDPDLAAANATRTALGRDGLLGVTLLLCSDASSHVTAQALYDVVGFTAK